MSVFAVMDVKKGEELTFSYTPTMNSYESRKSHLVKYGVVCDCRLCELDREDPRCGEREELTKGLTELIKRSQTVKKTISVLTRVVEQVRETYANRSDDRKTQIYWPLKALASAHQRTSEYAKAVKLLLEAVECIPESAMITYGLWAYVQIALCCDRMRRTRKARQYAQMAADLHRIRCGDDDELFKKIHPDIAHLL